MMDDFCHFHSGWDVVSSASWSSVKITGRLDGTVRDCLDSWIRSVRPGAAAEQKIKNRRRRPRRRRDRMILSTLSVGEQVASNRLGFLRSGHNCGRPIRGPLVNRPEALHRKRCVCWWLYMIYNGRSYTSTAASRTWKENGRQGGEGNRTRRKWNVMTSLKSRCASRTVPRSALLGSCPSQIAVDWNWQSRLCRRLNLDSVLERPHYSRLGGKKLSTDLAVFLRNELGDESKWGFPFWMRRW